jgi:release factor glutamine methyltransferase
LGPQAAGVDPSEVLPAAVVTWLELIQAPGRFGVMPMKKEPGPAGPPVPDWVKLILAAILFCLQQRTCRGGETHYRQISAVLSLTRPCGPPGIADPESARGNRKAATGKALFMSASLPSQSPADWSAIVTRLRAAGCVFAEDEAQLLISAARTPADLAAMVDRRAAGLPLEHVLGWAEFCGLRIAVDPGVFVPRRRTEFLVRQATALARKAADEASHVGHGEGPASQARPVVIVDLCCGSGAVGIALAVALDPVELHAADVDPVAATCACRNVAAVGGQVYQGDLYAPLPAALRGRVGLLTANVPYIPTEQIGLLPAEARLHEPRVALDGGADGLDVLRRVAAAAPQWLAPGGHLLTETSERQAPQAAEIVARAGLVPQVASSDELSATVVIGCRPGR